MQQRLLTELVNLLVPIAVRSLGRAHDVSDLRLPEHTIPLGAITKRDHAIHSYDHTLAPTSSLPLGAVIIRIGHRCSPVLFISGLPNCPYTIELGMVKEEPGIGRRGRDVVLQSADYGVRDRMRAVGPGLELREEVALHLGRAIGCEQSTSAFRSKTRSRLRCLRP